MKRVLITGAGSYIGTSFENWVRERYPGEFSVDTVDMVDGSWREKCFSGYDAILHVAAIVHKKEKPQMESLYQKVNTELPIEVAKKAKREGVHQFIFMSSMSVYGMNTGIITSVMKPAPKTFYGKSKLAAEENLNTLSDINFSVVILRPPMVYGAGCKGNYQLLKKFVSRCPIFPIYKNQRSMISIANLCEFMVQIIINKKSGLYFPQNRHYVCTSDLVHKIAADDGRKIYMTHLFNPLICLGLKLHITVIEKVFGNLIYQNAEKGIKAK